jgi:hypothetical protein
MRTLVAAALLVALVSDGAAQPADCRVDPTSGPELPLSIDLAGRPGVPAGTSGQAYVNVPLTPPGVACRDAREPPRDVLRGEPGDLLRGPAQPRVTVEVK